MYYKMTKNEYKDFYLESKHIKVQEDFTAMIWAAFLKSPYTKGDNNQKIVVGLQPLAERLEWDMHRLNMVLSGDKTIDFYEATHVAGALGYQFKVSIKELEGVDDE